VIVDYSIRVELMDYYGMIIVDIGILTFITSTLMDVVI